MSTASAAGASRTSSRARRVVAPLLVAQVALWLALFVGAGLFRAGPNGKSLATDFAVFSGAASALRHGHNPYDYRALYGAERSLMARERLPVTSNERNVRAGNPPLFYWALEPLLAVPFRTAAWTWIIAMYAVSGLGCLAALVFVDWRRRLLPLAVFLLMPQVVLGACYGNIHGIVFAALACALLLDRRLPFVAGCILSLAWLKPQLVLPLALLIILLHSARPLRMLSGLLFSTAALVVLTGIATGWNSLDLWLAGLAGWSNTVGLEPNLASLVGLYVGWAPFPLRVALGAAGLLVAVGATWRVWRTDRRVGPVTLADAGWLWFLWFLVAPFAHFPDEILLTIPLLALFGRDGSSLRHAGPAAALYLTFFSLILFPAMSINANFLSVVVGALGILSYRDARERRALSSDEYLAA